jgi:hypothetical protein
MARLGVERRLPPEFFVVIHKRVRDIAGKHDVALEDIIAQHGGRHRYADRDVSRSFEDEACFVAPVELRQGIVVVIGDRHPIEIRDIDNAAERSQNVSNLGS